ncbi:MAG: hypothetical protein WC601_01730 [Desulfotomaculaceae bacterium]
MLKKQTMALVITTVMVLVLATVAGAAIPNNSVIIGNKAFSIDYLMEPSHIDEISQALDEAGDAPTYYQLNGVVENLTDVFTGQPITVQQEEALPAITYKDGSGNVTQYASGNGNEISVYTATADVTVGAMSFKDINIKNCTMPGAAQFKVDGSSRVNSLGTAIRIMSSSDTVGVSILADDGITVLATGTLNIDKTATGVTFNITATGNTPVPIADTATADVTVGAMSFKDINVKSCTIPGAAQFKLDGSILVNSFGTSIRMMNSSDTVNISILAADGITVLATGTLNIDKTATGVTFNVTSTGATDLNVSLQ